MSKRILIESRNDHRQIALMDEQRLLFFGRDAEAAIEAEQIYLGVAERIVKGMEAIFVRIGKNAVGFLPFSECKEKPKSGDKILVQVKRPPTGEKAAYLTCDLSLAGRYVIMTPFTNRFSVSKRIESMESKNRLLMLAKRIAPGPIGLVMRQESEHAMDCDVEAEVQLLLDRWRKIQDQVPCVCAPAQIEKREQLLERILRDERGGIAEIITNAPETQSGLAIPTRFHECPFSLYNVTAKLEKSLRRKIWLDCGGYLIIDRTEAMTVIDVNSGKFTGGKSGTEALFLKLNQEAALEIARLLRLRNIGGIIIIDFVDMREEASLLSLRKSMEEALRDDPVKTVIHGFTSLGLMEMTRKKTEDSSVPLPICPRCQGAGIIEDLL